MNIVYLTIDANCNVIKNTKISLSHFKQWLLISTTSDQRLRIVGSLMTSYGQSRRKALTRYQKYMEEICLFMYT